MEINIKNIQESISESRFAPYLNSSRGNIEQALEIYIFSCRLCEALYIPINILEITLRNNFHKVLADVYSHEWYDAFFDQFLDKEQNNITEVKRRLLDRKKRINSDNIVSNLSLGFWTGLLGGEYENNLWRPCFYKAFPNAPKPFKRRIIQKKLSVIKNLRNRIAHHEPIYSVNPEYVYKAILEVTGWMCEDTKLWIQKNSRFEEVYNNSKFANTELLKEKELVNIL